MPADTDHIRRDAFHAARSDIRIEMAKYIRRLDAEAKAHIETVLAHATGEVDGTCIGREAAQAAFGNWGIGDPREAIDAAPAAISATADA